MFVLSHLQQCHTTLERSRYSISFVLISPHDLWCHKPQPSQHTPWSVQVTGLSQYPHGKTEAFLGPGLHSMSPESIIKSVNALHWFMFVGSYGKNKQDLVNFCFLLAKFLTRSNFNDLMLKTVVMLNIFSLLKQFFQS